MTKRAVLLPSLILILSFVLSACMGLIPLDNEPATGNFGPKTSLQQQQTKTFEVLWKDLKDNYIYFDTAKVDWTALHTKYLDQINSGLTTDQFTELMKGLETDLPQGSLQYISRTDRIEADTTDTSTYEGIGAFVGFLQEPEPHIVLLAVIDGSPAEKAGLKAHDSILQIDGNPINLKEGLSAINRVRGPAGTSVTLSIQSPGKPERSIEVKRGKLTSTDRLEAQNIPGTNYGYLLFPPIGYDTLSGDVLKNLQTLASNQKLDGLILDLRIASSSGGWPLQELYTLFGDGTLGEFYDRNNKQMVQVKGQDVLNSQKMPLVVLVGKNTTGFPEIFAASLQSHKRAVLVGETTPGSVETGTSFYLPDGSEAFIETTSFRLSDGKDIGGTGVKPDITVDAGWDEILPNNDPVLDRAIEYLDKQK